MPSTRTGLRRRTRAAAATAFTLAAAIALAGCSPSSPTSDSGNNAPSYKLTAQTPKPSGDIDSFTWVSYAEPFSLDYVYAFDYSDNQVLSNVCESMLRLNPDFSISPGLAESYSNPTPLTWVYEMRPGVTFHDGTPMTAADAVASMRRNIDPAVGSSWFSTYQNVKSIDQTGPMEVTVTLTKPDSQFNLGISGSAGVVESAHTLAEKGKNYGNSTGLVNCTGPFELTAWKAGESVTLTRYDNYWDTALRAKAKQVTILFMTDPNARVNALTSGQVDGGWMVPSEAINKLQASKTGNLYFGLNTAVNSLVVGNLNGVLGNVEVRKALLMALDRQGMVDAAAKGFGEVTNALTTESVWGEATAATRKAAFSDLTDYKYDVAAAKKLVEKAGATGKTIVIRTAPMGNDFAIVAQGTAAAAKSIGLKATIQTMTPDAYTTLFSDPSARKGVDLFYTSWYLSTPDPLEMYGVLQTGQFSNYGNWSDPQFDKLVNTAVGTADPEPRAQISVKLQKIANQQLPWLPLFQGPMTVYLGKHITGVAPSVAMLYYPWAATIGAR
ncbi:ABC transporter substrate-binding protein [Rathayibacter soli]|uniref:ABC transporter substrate-binding protein n=1 Tax=Rathayibacter soli TaxID=3144168 RepID=UPI0027E4AB27|nr:ABC transporter substrate-binding protein [Glaciibacter superstes]